MSKDTELYKKLSNWRMGTIKTLYDEGKYAEMFRFMDQEMPVPEKPNDYDMQVSFARGLKWVDPSTPSETLDFVVNLVKAIAISGSNIDTLFDIPYSAECFNRFWGLRQDPPKAQPMKPYVQPKPMLNVEDIAGPNDWPNLPHTFEQKGIKYTLLKTGQYWKHTS